MTTNNRPTVSLPKQVVKPVLSRRELRAIRFAQEKSGIMLSTKERMEFAGLMRLNHALQLFRNLYALIVAHIDAMAKLATLSIKTIITTGKGRNKKHHSTIAPLLPVVNRFFNSPIASALLSLVG